MLFRFLATTACCTGAAVGTCVITPPLPVQANPYVEFENNSNFLGGDLERDVTTTDLHIGYEGEWEDLGYYIQVGPSYSDGTGDTELGVSGKGGFSLAVSDQIKVYGELGFRAEDDVDTNYTTKFGTRFTF